MKAFVSPWMNKEKNTGYLAASSKVTLVFELSRIFPCLTVQVDTTSYAQILRGAESLQTKQAIKWRSLSSLTCRVIPIRSSVLILLLSSSSFWTFGSAILRKTSALKRLWRTSRRKRHGAFKLMIAWTPMYKDH